MSINKYENGVLTRLDGITETDATPTQNSTRPVSSGGVYDALVGLVPLKIKNIQCNLSDKTFVQSGGGIYYYNSFSVGEADIDKIVALSIYDFHSMTASEVLTPIIYDGDKVGFLSNHQTTYATIDVTVLYTTQ